MATLLLAVLIALASRHSVSANTFNSSSRSCLAFQIPVAISAQSANYDIPYINNSIDATEFAVASDTWSTTPALQRITQNFTVKSTYSISAQLCTPGNGSSVVKSSILQIATHGLAFDKRYWDASIDPQQYSYVNAALSAGYSILTYDRLGTGQSDKPDAYTVVQAPLELQILRQITIMARSGALQKLAKQQKDCPDAIRTLAPLSKVVHVGHSFGSFLSVALLTSYGNLSDGAIITGFIANKEVAQIRATSFGFQDARTNDPIRFSDRPRGYIVPGDTSNVQAIFFHKSADGTSFDPKVLAFAEQIKQTITVGEWVSLPALNLGYAPDFKGPIQFMEAEFDFAICGGNCRGTYDVALIKEIYPNSTDVDVYLQPQSGHALTLHRNATAGYAVSLKWLDGQGL